MKRFILTISLVVFIVSTVYLWKGFWFSYQQELAGAKELQNFEQSLSKYDPPVEVVPSAVGTPVQIAAQKKSPTSDQKPRVQQTNKIVVKSMKVDTAILEGKSVSTLNHASGSFERLRVDISGQQAVTGSDSSGSIQVANFAQEASCTISASSFATSSQVIVPHRFFYSFLSPGIDESVNTGNKVRIRSLQDVNAWSTEQSAFALTAPVYALSQEETARDEAKFTIDFSIVDSLNQDIISMFSDYGIMNDILGSPNLAFSTDYPDLTTLQSIYFNRLTSKINLRGFFTFYKWFCSNFSIFIEQLISTKLDYKGINYVIESHSANQRTNGT
jgi:hypothetical protein